MRAGDRLSSQTSMGIELRIIFVLLLAGGLVAGGWWAGADHVQAKWDKLERDRAEISAEDLRLQAKGQHRASEIYQRQRAAQAALLAKLTEARHDALAAPAPACKPGQPAGDIVLPGSIGRLLNAIANHKPASAPTR